jgi:hypothetical protein
MKKLVALTVVVLALGVTAASAEHHGDDKDHGPRGAKMFEKLDADGNGSVTKDEFMKAQEAHFAEMDANGDGAFTKDEAEAIREKIKEMRKQREETKADAPAVDTPADAPAVEETPATETPAVPTEEKPAE